MVEDLSDACIVLGITNLALRLSIGADSAGDILLFSILSGAALRVGSTQRVIGPCIKDSVSVIVSAVIRTAI